jgi:molybdate transport system ATP-binding protein
MTLHADVHVRRGTLDLDVTLEVGAGETVVLLGPNGAGKTTLLSVVAGLVGLDEGRIALDDLVLDDPQSGEWVPTERRPIGYVFQDQLLFPHLSAVDNVAFGLRAGGRRRADARREAMMWLERFGLAAQAGARPGELSGGQGQRVALARALARAPSMVLLDEPLAALDATTRMEVRRDLGRHLGSFDGPRLVVTHDPIDVMALADRVIVLEHGQVAQTGTLADLRATPRSRYVADLVGINLYRGTLFGSRVTLPEGGELVVVNDDHRTGEVFAAVRPEAVALHRDRPEGSPRNTWAARVMTIDHEGPRARVTLGGSIPITAEITERAADELGVAVGTNAWVSVKATEIETYAAA